MSWSLPRALRASPSASHATIPTTFEPLAAPPAQSSCAAQFVYSHIDDLDVPWLHVDIAGPAWRHDRGTGFGVGLLAGVADAVRNGHLSE